MRRDEACLTNLIKLNPNVNVNIFQSYEDLKRNIKNFDVVIITELNDLEYINEINQICRNFKKKMIYSSVLGLSGFIFNDFGDEHIIINKTGEEPKSFYINNITKGKEGIITVDLENEGSSLFEFSEFVTFKNIKGMIELNEKKAIKIKVITKDTFSIGDISNFSDYISGGIVKEAFIQIKQKYFPLNISILNPYNEGLLCLSINMKKGRKELYHICLYALHHFYSIHNSLPEINNELHIREVLKHAKLIFNIIKEKSWLKKISILDENYLRNIIKWSRCSISPVCSFLGGIVSQEIIKIFGKYQPINQWLYFDFFEKLNYLEKNCLRDPMNSRYDEQIAIFGRSFQEKLSNLNVFIIGAGALGCEFLKIFSLMGIGTKHNKCITVTDNDHIELSNLNRQFLFRKEDISKSKSFVSCREAKKINEEPNYNPTNYKVGYETEDIFNDYFWEVQDLIIGAVDNINARNYIDNQCTFYNKIFLECGTSGTSASSMVIYPKKTSCYNDLEKVVTKEVEMCTLKLFPSKIEHCIEFCKLSFS